MSVCTWENNKRKNQTKSALSLGLAYLPYYLIGVRSKNKKVLKILPSALFCRYLQKLANKYSTYSY